MELFERIHNVATGEITERPYTEEEIAENKANEARLNFEAETLANIEATKIALLNKLGLTADEAKLLLS